MNQKTFIILRNGRPDALLNKEAVSYEDVIRKLPAMGFTKIKVLNNPPKRYEGYDYVIDIEADPLMRLVGVTGRVRNEYNFDNREILNTTGFVGSVYDFRFSGRMNYIHSNSRITRSELTRDIFSTGNMREIDVNIVISLYFLVG